MCLCFHTTHLICDKDVCRPSLHFTLSFIQRNPFNVTTLVLFPKSRTQTNEVPANIKQFVHTIKSMVNSLQHGKQKQEKFLTLLRTFQSSIFNDDAQYFLNLWSPSSTVQVNIVSIVIRHVIQVYILSLFLL